MRSLSNFELHAVSGGGVDNWFGEVMPEDGPTGPSWATSGGRPVEKPLQNVWIVPTPLAIFKFLVNNAIIENILAPKTQDTPTEIVNDAIDWARARMGY